ncbi:hypothetical protein [Cytobacillus sp. NCCP-133]|uniref:hypothetical protein n=1 Tax=Cytobacillus sp. NCCP-133 TaxID=766848 RepID=UPI00222EC46B|nr:hypothetical protein [Cytobacillus sp. NCCP-133]
MIARWLGLNILTVLLILLWSWHQGCDSNQILLGKVLAQAAFILFLINLNMYFLFLLIRKSKIRKVKVTLAKTSKRMMKYHIAIAIPASMLILIHAVIMISVRLEDLWQAKAVSGIATLIVLSVLIFSGMLRRRKSTGKRRKFHYMLAFLFFVFVFLHVFV